MTTRPVRKEAARPGLRRPLYSLVAIVFSALVAVAAEAQGPFVPADETPEEFPDHPGREEAFYGCTACHGFKLVAQQGQSRRQWDETIDLMTAKHGMPKLEGDDRKTVLDYLEASFPPRAPAARGWQNPFLGR